LKQQGKFILLTLSEFKQWISQKSVLRKIKLIQNHHTFKPDYSNFTGSNHFSLLTGMESYHIHSAGMAEIAQNFTTFNDGMIAVCRTLDKAPAGIKGANQYGICIEHLGNFDGKDQITDDHQRAIIGINALLCKKFKLIPSVNSIVYHHWYDLDTGERKDGQGNAKSCPGTHFFDGNSVQTAEDNFIPLIKKEMS
jgi:hypothetical protein